PVASASLTQEPAALPDASSTVTGTPWAGLPVSWCTIWKTQTSFAPVAIRGDQYATRLVGGTTAFRSWPGKSLGWSGLRFTARYARLKPHSRPSGQRCRELNSGSRYRRSNMKWCMYSIVACCSLTWKASTSPIVITPASRCSFTTGRWRMRLAVIIAAHSSTLVSGAHAITGLVIASATRVVVGSRCCATTRRRMSRSVKMPTGRPAAASATPPLPRSFMSSAARSTVSLGAIVITSLPFLASISRTVAMDPPPGSGSGPSILPRGARGRHRQGEVRVPDVLGHEPAAVLVHPAHQVLARVHGGSAGGPFGGRGPLEAPASLFHGHGSAAPDRVGVQGQGGRHRVQRAEELADRVAAAHGRHVGGEHDGVLRIEVRDRVGVARAGEAGPGGVRGVNGLLGGGRGVGRRGGRGGAASGPPGGGGGDPWGGAEGGSSIGPPQRCARPQPAVTIRVWPSGWVCQAVRAPGSNVTLAPSARAGSCASNKGSMRTVPVKYSAGPLPDGWEPTLLMSIF